MDTLEKNKMLKEIEKVIPDFRKYFFDWEVEEMTEDDLIYRIEWELDLIDDWEEEGFSSPKEVSNMINECGTRKARYLLKRLYKIMEED